MPIIANSTSSNSRSLHSADLNVGSKSQSADFAQAFALASTSSSVGLNSFQSKSGVDVINIIDAHGSGFEQSFVSLVEDARSLCQSLQTEAVRKLRKEEMAPIAEQAIRIQKELLCIGSSININDQPITEKETDKQQNKKDAVDIS